MSNEHDTPTDAAPTPQPGPDVLAERTLTGIFVHLIGLLTSFIGPLLIYAASDHEFTQKNARNAMNWQLFYLTTLVGALLLFGAAFVADIVLPDMIVIALFLVVFAFFLGIMIIGFLNIVFPLVATGKAIFGGAWKYPIAPDFFNFDWTSINVEFDWWKLTQCTWLLHRFCSVRSFGLLSVRNLTRKSGLEHSLQRYCSSSLRPYSRLYCFTKT